jgi:hypothetical protein
MFKKLLFVFIVFLSVQCKEKSSGNEASSATPPKDSLANLATETALADQLPDSTAKTEEVTAALSNSNLDNAARYISGLPISKTSKFYSKTQDTSWIKFSQRMDSSWKNIEKTRLAPMRAWAKEELKDRNDDNKPLFYPFSGPDFLNAFTFFPNTPTYYMFALENLGKVPNVASLSKKQSDTLIASVNASLSDIFKKSYFITKRMLVHLDQNKVNGVTPLILHFLARTGNSVVEIKAISLSPSGKIVEYARFDSLKHKKNRGVKITFTKKGETQVRTIYYFKVDLEDKALAVNTSFTNFLNGLGTMNCYLKSASYLLHYRDFSTIRNIALEKSDFLLQDDSGIAYHFFNPKKWKIQLYGKYAKPVRDFSGVDQIDLKKVYATDSTVKELPFTIGYHWGSKEVNLMRVIKK